MKRIDISGRRFGRLVTIKYLPDAGRRGGWLCKCDCGSTMTTEGDNLRSGRTKSCGCLMRELTSKRATKHGMHKSSEYDCWNAIRSRCNNPKNIGFAHYGGRGIRVCDRWQNDFPAFFADMGKKPSKEHSIERIDTNGNYEPGNCRWATKFQQANNYRRTHRLTLNGVTRGATEWARIIGISAYTIIHRIQRGWSHEKALTTKPHRRPYDLSRSRLLRSKKRA